MRIPRLMIPAALLLALIVPAAQAQLAKARKPAGPAGESARRTASPNAPAAAPTARPADMDANHDGKVTRSEWKGNDVSFQMLDRNGDGSLSGEELSAGAAPAAEEPAAAFARIDGNHDGRVTREEWQGGLGEFQALDRNSDGVLTRDEFLSTDLAHARQERLFRWMDANHDNRVTQAEWRGDLTKFQRLDRNHDGVVTLAEMEGK
jgi:Ca2+-binding EF-hand superfamily protein